MDDDGSSSLAMAMEADKEETNLLNELMHGKELAVQLQLHLNSSSSSFWRSEKGELLVQDTIKSYENALSILLRKTGPSQDPLRESLESPQQRSEESDSKKRMNVIRWTKKVQIGRGVDLEDGYNWRKYGQKDIHKANFPRNYFRCTQRNTQGCLATKQVQRSDEDPTLFNVSYRGSHTCSSNNNNNITSTITPSSEPPPIHVDHHQYTSTTILNPFIRISSLQMSSSNSKLAYMMFVLRELIRMITHLQLLSRKLIPPLLLLLPPAA